VAPLAVGCGKRRFAGPAQPNQDILPGPCPPGPSRQNRGVACHARWPARRNRRHPGGGAPPRQGLEPRPAPMPCHGCCTPRPNRARPGVFHGPVCVKWPGPAWPAATRPTPPTPSHAHGHPARRRCAPARAGGENGESREASSQHRIQCFMPSCPAMPPPSALTVALMSWVKRFLAASSNTRVRGTVASAFMGSFSSISMTW